MRAVRILALLLPWLVSAQVPDRVQTAKLKNGLKILVEEDHTLPTVALYFFYRVGSRDERPGITGISHFFEHMMFNGSARFGPGEFDREMERRGGSNNAYTSKDVTVYTDWFPPDALELMFDMEADRMAHLSLDPKSVESERGVVYSERRLRVDNDNGGALSEQVTAEAITAHPYHWPVIGWPSDIESWTREDLHDYYLQGYAPNNCVMVVVGDINYAAIVELSRKYFEPIPSHPTFPEPRTKEPEQDGERVVRIRKPAELPLLMMAFHSPETRNQDTSAINLIETLLGTGESSRLQQRLVNREQVALSAQVYDEPSLDPYLVTLAIQPRAGVDVGRVQALTLEELNKLANAPVTAGELAKARNQWLVMHYRELKTVAGRANLLGTAEVFLGTYKRLYTQPDEINRVTPADIQRVAKTLFRPENRTVGILDPVREVKEAKR